MRSGCGPFGAPVHGTHPVNVHDVVRDVVRATTAPNGAVKPLVSIIIPAYNAESAPSASRRSEAFLQPREDGAMRLERNQPQRPRNRRVIRRRRVEAMPTKLSTSSESAARHAISQQADVPVRRKTRPAPSPGRRTADTRPSRTARSRPRRGSRSAWDRTDGAATLATRWSTPTSASARWRVCPSPWAALYGPPVVVGEGFLMTFTTGC
jgi:hypothetical protein